LHGRGIAGGVVRTQGGVGGGAPFAAAFAVAAGALDVDRPEARREGAGVAVGETGEGWAADGAAGWGGVGLGLGAALDRVTEQFLDVVRGLGFEMAEVLIVGLHEALDGAIPGAGRAGGQDRQRFGRDVSRRAVGNRLKAGAIQAGS